MDPQSWALRVQLEFGDSGFAVCGKLLHVHVSGLGHDILGKDLEIRDGQKGSSWESCVDKVNRGRSIIHADVRWFRSQSAGHVAESDDQLALHQSPCVSVDPSVEADQRGRLFGTKCGFEVQAMGLE